MSVLRFQKTYTCSSHGQAPYCGQDVTPQLCSPRGLWFGLQPQKIPSHKGKCNFFFFFLKGYKEISLQLGKIYSLQAVTVTLVRVKQLFQSRKVLLFPRGSQSLLYFNLLQKLFLQLDLQADFFLFLIPPIVIFTLYILLICILYTKTYILTNTQAQTCASYQITKCLCE